MLDSNPDAITNTNSKRVCIMKNSDGSYLIFNAAAPGQETRATATGLGDAMAVAYRLMA
jgi:hypothetical protein